MSGFVSLDELPAELENRFSVAWQFTSSNSFDDHALELNERHTRHTLRAYGFGGLVVQSYFGEDATYDMGSVSVSDLNPDGSATGSAATSGAHAERASASVQYERRGLFLFSEWPTATVRINRTALANRVANRVQAGVNERRAQTTELDAALRLGLWKAGLQKAKGDFNLIVDFSSAFFSSTMKRPADS